MNIKIYAAHEDDLLNQAEALIRDIESTVSVTSEDSEIYALNRDKKVSMSSITNDLLTSAIYYGNSTNGALDVSIYPIVKAWGFTTDKQAVPSSNVIAELLPHVNYKKIQIDSNAIASIDPDMEIDLGSVTKGYTSDQLISLFRDNGVENAIVSLGGNVQTLGTKPDGNPWKVAIRDPFSDEYAAALSITDKAVITSGNYERFFEENGKRYHHIMDPSTGAPSENGIASVTIIADSGTKADALSTALFVMGIDKASEYWRKDTGFDVIFITTDGQMYITPGIKSSFTALGQFASAKIHTIE